MSITDYKEIIRKQTNSKEFLNRKEMNMEAEHDMLDDELANEIQTYHDYKKLAKKKREKATKVMQMLNDEKADQNIQDTILHFLRIHHNDIVQKHKQNQESFNEDLYILHNVLEHTNIHDVHKHSKIKNELELKLYRHRMEKVILDEVLAQQKIKQKQLAFVEGYNQKLKEKLEGAQSKLDSKNGLLRHSHVTIDHRMDELRQEHESISKEITQILKLEKQLQENIKKHDIKHKKLLAHPLVIQRKNQADVLRKSKQNLDIKAQINMKKAKELKAKNAELAQRENVLITNANTIANMNHHSMAENVRSSFEEIKEKKKNVMEKIQVHTNKEKIMAHKEHVLEKKSASMKDKYKEALYDQVGTAKALEAREMNISVKEEMVSDTIKRLALESLPPINE